MYFKPLWTNKPVVVDRFSLAALCVGKKKKNGCMFVDMINS